MVVDHEAVMAEIRMNTRKGAYPTRVDFYETLWLDFFCSHEGVDFPLSASTVSGWDNGRRPVSSKLVNYYCTAHGELELACTIRDRIMPRMVQSENCVSALHALVVSDGTIAPRKRAELVRGYPFADRNSVARFIAKVVIFAMARGLVVEAPACSVAA